MLDSWNGSLLGRLKGLLGLILLREELGELAVVVELDLVIDAAPILILIDFVLFLQRIARILYFVNHA